MKSKDQQLLEEAYNLIKESHPHSNPPTGFPKTKSPVENIRAADKEARNTERNAGVPEEPYKPPFRPTPVEKPYKNRIGQWYIKLPPNNDLNLDPGTYRLNSEFVTDNGKYLAKIVWNKEENKPEKIDLGAYKSMSEPTEWGVKDVPGGDID